MPREDLLPGGWSLDRRIGSGAFADVYAGCGPDGAPVAVKILRDGSGDSKDVVATDQARKRFQREITVLRALPDSPHLVGFRDCGETATGRPFLVMELVDGYTLGALISSGHVLGAREACRLLVQLTDAFSGLHHLGVAHGDVNPDNILITADGRRAKLIDFGLVRDSQGLLQVLERERVISGADFSEDLDSGLLMGSPQYMAPEQIADAHASPDAARKTDTGSDVYGLGVLLYQLVTGRVPHPFRPTTRGGRAYHAQVMKYCKGRLAARGTPFDAEDVPAGLATILRCALAADPRQRYPDARDLQAALKRYLADGYAPTPTLARSTIRRPVVSSAAVREEVVLPEPPAAHDEPAPSRTRIVVWIVAGAVAAVLFIACVHLFGP